MFEFLRKKFHSIILLFAIAGPGLITAMVDNDAGGITTYSVAGAHFGFSALWIMVPATFVLIVIQEMCARMGVVSGKGLSDLIREIYGAKVTFYMLIGLLIANLATIISEFAGIASSLEIFSVPRYISVPIIAVFIWFLIVKGSYRSVEKVFLVAALIYFSYIISGFLAKPDWSEVLIQTVRPAIDYSKEYLIIAVGIIGTTITPWMQFYLQASVVEKGIKKENYAYTKLDVIGGSIVAGAVAFFIMVASAATLFTHGISVESASDAAIALEPFAGRFAEILFAVGLLNASLLGAMIVPLATSFYLCEGLGFEAGVNKSFKEAPWFNGIFTALIILGAIPALFPKTPLIKVMLTSQVINGILLAPVLIFIILIVNKKWLMGQFANRTFGNIIGWFTVIVLIVLSVVLALSGIGVV
ncbi:Nramp family divalent metal transporter [Candidatus Peregrinibacteria bacterium]|nr:Nramp family divalent metal transporter [Candidatus Peregrinibacteria bacterium]